MPNRPASESGALGVTALFSAILAVRGLWEPLPRPIAAQHKQGASA